MIKSNNKSNLFLLFVVAVIWGVIGIKVFNYFSGGSEPEIMANTGLEFDLSSEENAGQQDSVKQEVSYIDLKRDPFMFSKKRAVKKKNTAPVEQAKIENNIDFVINGVIMKEDRKLVILQDRTNNSTMFLREGERYKNLKINFISPSGVSLMQNNEEKKIILE